VLLAVTTVLCKSLGPIVLLVVGVAAMLVVRARRSSLALVSLALFPVAYMVLRSTGIWSFQSVVDWTTDVTDAQRGGSLGVRVESETVLIEHAMKRPWLGWGGWGRNRPDGMKDLLTDGLWAIYFAQGGLLRVVAFVATQLTPVLLVVRRIPASDWLRPQAAAVACLATVLALAATDNLFNAGVAPTYTLMMGAVTGACAQGYAARKGRAPLGPPRAGSARGRFVREGRRPPERFGRGQYRS
jgi:hypothetical protein